jgi:hypothetical protein
MAAIKRLAYAHGKMTHELSDGNGQRRTTGRNDGVLGRCDFLLHLLRLLLLRSLLCT